MRVEWQPFELRPEPQPTLRPEGDYLQQAWARSVYPLAARLGVPIVLPRVSPQPHTRLAWEGYQYARERGKGNDYNGRVLRAFFVEGQDIGRPEVLARLAGEVGLEADDFQTALATGRYREGHQRALRRAYHTVRVTAVPAFVIGGRMLTGVQDRGTLAAVIEQALEPGSRRDG